MFPQRDALPVAPTDAERQDCGMKRDLTAILAVAVLALVGCSSAAKPDDTIFCSSMASWFVDIGQIGTEMDSLGEVLNNIEDIGDLSDVDAIHALGVSLLSLADQAERDATTAKANVEDPEVIDAIDQLSSLMIRLARGMGAAARDATSVLDFIGALDGLVDLIDEMNNLDSDALMGVIDDYGQPICDVSLDTYVDRPRAQDTATKADVSTLGKEIATYYVDWQTGDPDPVITISGSDYFLLDTNIGAHSANVTITDQYYNGPSDWCVEVTNDQGDLKTFTYSAQRGLEQGTCT